MKLKNLLIVTVMSLVAFSCSKSDESSIKTVGEGPMSFNVSVISEGTANSKSQLGSRQEVIPLYNEDGSPSEYQLVAYSVPTESPEAGSQTKAKLFGKGTGGNTNYEFFENLQFSGWLDGTQIYTASIAKYNGDVKLWIPTESITEKWNARKKFEAKAIYPYDPEKHGMDFYDYTFEDYLSFTYTEPVSSADQQDIMMGYFYGTPSGSTAEYNIADIKLSHALASVRFSFVNNKDFEMTLEEISIADVHKSGTCEPSLKEGRYQYVWTPGDDKETIVAEGTFDIRKTEDKKQEQPVGLDYTYGNDFVFTVIPQDLAENNVALSVVLYSDKVIVTLKGTVNSGEWKAGYTTIYRLTPISQTEPVDLGLSVIWSDRALGGINPFLQGDFFRWAETVPRSDLPDDSPYKYGDEYDNMTKYNNEDKLIYLEPEDDAATVILGNGWRTPTDAEFAEVTSETQFLGTGGGNPVIHSICIGIKEGYTNSAIVFVPSEGNEPIYLTAERQTDNIEDHCAVGLWINNKCDPVPYTYLDYKNSYDWSGIKSDKSGQRSELARPVRPVKSVLVFNNGEFVNPTTIKATAGSTVNFSIAEEYTNGSWTVTNEAGDETYDSGTGSGSITVPSVDAGTKIVIRRDTGIVCGTIEVK